MFHSFTFKLHAISPERRAMMTDLSDWLRATVGNGFFSITHPEVVENHQRYSDAKWIIVCYDDHLKVLLREGQDAKAFSLRWT